jgi:para-nitrobenzyl esterase
LRTIGLSVGVAQNYLQPRHEEKTMTRRAYSTRLCVAWALCAVSIGCGDDDKAPTTGSSNNPATGNPSVQLDDGPLEGRQLDNNVQAFLGIPYAKPPLGDLRWQPPQAPDKWTKTLDASDYGGRCAQPESTTLMNAASDNEDCLYANVWTPSVTSKDKLPVMFWIHGGGNVNGSASEPVPYANSGHFYEGQHIASKGVVVVSFNYRLGVFGFFGHEALAQKGGNQGLWDQTFALQWVKDNIAKFGGDPSNVTIFGESAGSLDVCFHVASPKSRGLFKQAISESGGCTTHTATADDAAKMADTLATTLGCTGSDALTCLRGKSVSDLLGAVPTGSGIGAGFGPSVDGDFLPDQPRTLYDSGSIAKVPYILGSNQDEGTLFTVGQPAITDADGLTAAVTAEFGAAGASTIIAQYPMSNFSSDPQPYQAAFSRMVGDAILVCTTFDTAERAAKNGNTIRMYNFDIPADVPVPDLNLGATHGSELVYVFGTSPNFTPDEQTASDRMETYWTNFAKTGNPNGGDLLNWPELTTSSNQRIQFALDVSILNDFRATECAFWRATYDMAFTN